MTEAIQSFSPDTTTLVKPPVIAPKNIYGYHFWR